MGDPVRTRRPSAQGTAVRSLVTGAGGFVGRHLCDHLRNEGDNVLALRSERNGGVDLLDADGLNEAVRQDAPDVVYHLAGQADVSASWKDPAGTFRTNAEGTLNLLEAAKNADVRRVMVVSSAEVYGIVDGSTLPIGEDAPLCPVTPYAASKVSAEYLSIQAALSSSLETVRVRAFNHIGPGQSTNFVTAAIASRIVENEQNGAGEVTVGDLTPRRDFTDVRDVVRAYRLVMTRGTNGCVYNVCSGTDFSVQQLADRLARLATTATTFVCDDSLRRPVDLPALIGDNHRIVTDTGWEPSFTVDQTLDDVMTDMRQRVTRAG